MQPSAPSFACPKCKGLITPDSAIRSLPNGGDLYRCISCGWEGESFFFHPVAFKIEHAADAIADDAACLHHPSKRAIAICAGSGDYICSLCAIEVDGKIYGAHYLSAAGKSTASKAFDNRLPRPDTEAFLAFLVSLPFWFVSPLSVGYGLWRYIQATGLRQTNPLYASVVSSRRLTLLGIFGGLVALGSLLLFAIIVVEVFTDSRHH